MRRLRSTPTEDGELEILPEAVDVLKADIPQPRALILDQGEDVVSPVGSADVFCADLLEGDRLALVLPPTPEVLAHRVVIHALTPNPAAGDVLAVQERAS